MKAWCQRRQVRVTSITYAGLSHYPKCPTAITTLGHHATRIGRVRRCREELECGGYLGKYCPYFSIIRETLWVLVLIIYRLEGAVDIPTLFYVADLSAGSYYSSTIVPAETYPPGSTVREITVFMVLNL